MSDQVISVTKKRGRPAKPPTAVVRLPVETIEAAIQWGADQPDKPAAPEAIRRLIEKGLNE